MPLEIRELVIRAEVVEEIESEEEKAQLAEKFQQMKAEVLELCQEILQEMLEEKQIR